MTPFATAAAWLIGAHGLAEYGPQWPRSLEEPRLKSHAWRGAVFLGLALVGLGTILDQGSLVGLVYLSAGRELVRFARGQLESRWPRSLFTWRLYEVSVQAGLLAIWLLAYRPFSFVATGPWALLVAAPAVQRGLLTAVGWLAVCRLGTILVRSLLHQLGREPSSPEAAVNHTHYGAGRAIGNLERTLILFLALNDQLAAVGLVLTAKSLARFEDLKDRDFAEYYLLGTLTSTLIALLMAWLLQTAWTLWTPASP